MDSAAIVEKLKSTDIDKRSVWHISRLSGPDALPLLIAALKQTSPPAPGLIEAIGTCQYPSAAAAAEASQVVEDTLAARDAPILQCVEALARIGHPGSVPILSRLLVENWLSPDVAVRLLAIVTLGKIGSAAALPAVLHALAGRVSGSGFFSTYSWDQLAQRTDVPLPASGADDVDVPTLAAWAAGQIRSQEAVLPLVEAIRTRQLDKTFQRVAMFALTDSTRDYMEHLRPLLQDSLARVRYAVLSALAREAPHAHLEEFRAALKDKDKWVRCAAACGLAAAGSTDGPAALRVLLDEWQPDRAVKPAIFEEVARMRVRELLPEAFNSATARSVDAGLRAAAVKAVQSIVAGMTAEELIEAARPDRWTTKDVSLRLDQLLERGYAQSTPAVAGLLRAARDTVAPALEKSLDKRSLIVRARLERSPIVRARPVVAQVLLKAGLASDPQPWIRRLDYKNPHMSELAFFVLTGGSDPACQARLLEILGRNDSGLLGRLFGAGKTRPRAARRKVLACLALSRCGDEGALSPLLRWTSDRNVNIRAAAGAALAEVGLRHLPASRAAGVPEALMALWDVQSFSLRAALARYLGKAGHAAAAATLVQELEDAYGAGPFARYREILIRALAALEHAAVIPALTRAALGDPDQLVRAAASNALRTLTVAATESPEAIAEAGKRWCAHEAGLLARDVRMKPERDSRFSELLASETLLIHSILDADKPDPRCLAFEVYTAGMPPCCAVCLGEPDRSRVLSYKENVVRSLQQQTVTRIMSVRLCARCSVPPNGPDFSPMSMAKKYGTWFASFLNPRYGIMSMDYVWLATATDSGRRVFAAALPETIDEEAALFEPALAGGAADTRQAEAHFIAGKSSFIRKNYEHARAELEQAVRLAPRSPNSQFLFGATLVKLGRLEEALEPLRLSVRMVPDHADAQNALGMALGRLGRIEEAERHTARAASLGHPQAREMLDANGMDFCRLCAAPKRKGAPACPACGAQ